MQVLYLKRKTYAINSVSELESYFDAEITIQFDELRGFKNIPWLVNEVVVRSGRAIYVDDDIFHRYALQPDDVLCEMVDHKSFREISPARCLHEFVNLGDLYIVSPTLLKKLEETEFRVRNPEHPVSLRIFFGRGDIHFGPSERAREKITQYWRVVEFLSSFNSNHLGEVIADPRITHWLALYPELEFEAYHAKCLEIANSNRVPITGDFSQTVRETYDFEIMSKFREIPRALEDYLSEILMAEFDDCSIITRVSNNAIHIRRGIDAKMRPYFDKKFNPPETDE